jgi:hypothetical protein
MMVVRDHGGESLANAFLDPIGATDGAGLEELSLKRLTDYWARLRRMYGQDGIRGVAVATLHPEHLGPVAEHEVPSLDQLIAQTVAHLPMTTVLLRLEGALQSWGVDSRYDVRAPDQSRRRAASSGWSPLPSGAHARMTSPILPRCASACALTDPDESSAITTPPAVSSTRKGMLETEA